MHPIKTGWSEERDLTIKNPSEDPHQLSIRIELLIFAIGEKEQSNTRKLPEKELRILLLRRYDYPDRGYWELPGCPADLDLSLEKTAQNLVRKETGLDEFYLEQIYTFSDPDRIPHSRVISCAYMALVDATQLHPQARTEQEPEWFASICVPLNDDREHVLILDGPEQLRAQISRNESRKGNTIVGETELKHSDGLAFDHAFIIWTGIERLRSKLEYTPIAFSLLPLLFPLTELQQVYETILGRKLLAANFRRKIGHLVEETGQSRGDYRHRPARLFRFRS